MIECTGINCPMQVGSVNPADCKAAESCQYATRPVTRADLIRAMTDEELANTLSQFAYCYECPASKDCESTNDGCIGGILNYLKSEVGKDNEP